MDMSDFNAVVQAANEFSSQNQKLDILLNNAGLIVSNDRKTH